MKRIIIGLTAAACVLAGTPSASAAVAHWNFNEHRRATVLHDASGHGFRGHIGKHVRPGHGHHHFSFVKRGVVVPGHIDTVPDQPGLDPGPGYFSVKATFQWPRGDADNQLIQKGQTGAAGGLFKLKTNTGNDPGPGVMRCLFRGSNGDSTVSSLGHKRLDDGKWHTVRCWSDGKGTHLSVDGKTWDHNPKRPGPIANDWPVAIGGNTYCPADKGLQCNYFQGNIGDIVWNTG